MAENFHPKAVSKDFYYNRYLDELKDTTRGKRYPKQDKKTFLKVITLYSKYLILELMEGVEVWLPAKLGVIQMMVYQGFLPIKKGSGVVQRSQWLHLGWRQREGLTYPSMFKVALQEVTGKRLSAFYKENRDKLYKLIQK